MSVYPTSQPFTTMRCLMLCVVVVAVVALAGSNAEDDLPWWKTAILYQVYPRSFKDSDGDGIGDLKGISQLAGYFKEIGVTAIWVSPIFKSPMADFGYDVADFRSVDYIFGTIDDFRELVQTMKGLDIKLLLDLVPNHTSDQHPWFQWSVQRVDPYTHYYMWSDGKVDPTTNKTVPPNNWVGRFSGSAWEWREERQQYYLHNFLVEQPDLNYTNPAVLKEMDDIMKFWMDIGVDGFRVDAVPWLVEDPLFRDEPVVPGTSGKTYWELDHIYTQNIPETYDVCRHWADVVYNYSSEDGKQRVLFMEAYANMSSTLKYFGHGNESLMMPFNFQLLTNGNEASRSIDLYDIIMSWMTNITEDETSTWVLGNHDEPRLTERYGLELVDALNLLSGVLPGVKVTYYGDEIGMRNTFIRWDQTVDPKAIAQGPSGYLQASRDPMRTPMQWDSTDNAGFSRNKTWLPVNPDYWWLNVAAQRSAAVSHLKVFQTMAKARRDPVLQRGELKIMVPDNDTLLVTRTYNNSWYLLIINLGSQVSDYTSQSLFGPQGLDEDLTVVVASINSDISSGLSFQKGKINISLRPKAAVLIQSGRSSSSDTRSAAAPTSSNSATIILLASNILVIYHITK